MEDLKTKADILTDHVGDYLETYFNLTVLKATEKTAGIASLSVTAIFISFLVLFVLLFTGFGLSWWIGAWINNLVAGFFIVAGIYLVLIALLLFLRKKIVFPFIRNFIIQRIYD